MSARRVVPAVLAACIWLAALVLYSSRPPELPPRAQVREVRVYVLIDNHPYDGFRSPWGLALYVVADGVEFLFDAGPSAEDLLHNAELLGLDLSRVDFVVASHEHWDHVGGLLGLAGRLGSRTVYLPSRASPRAYELLEEAGYEVVPVGETTMVAPGVYVVGEMLGPPWEQAVAIHLKGRGLVVLVGCSHPGVDRIVERASRDIGARPYLVLGGFHLSGAPEAEVERVAERLIELGVSRIYPIHCSGELIRELLASEHPDEYGGGRVGLVLRLEAEP